MERLGIYEAKAKLSELADRVARGGEVTITKHGKAMAKLVPAKAGAEVDRKAVMEELRAFSKTIKLKKKKKLTLRELREAREWGRR